MSTNSTTNQKFRLPGQKNEHFVETKVSRYDLVNGYLLSLIIVWGFLVLAMFVIWLTSGSPRILPPPFLEMAVVSEEDEGEEDDLLDPGVDDFPDDDTPQLMNALEAIPDALSNIQASLQERSGDALKSGRGGGRGTRKITDGVPEHKRWVIQYESDSISTYARQLSFFNIDLAIFYRSTPNIFRIRDPGGSLQVIQSSREEENNSKSLRFMHKERRMIRWDEEIARRAGVNLEPDGVTCQFYPASTRQIIRRVEAEALQAAGRELRNVRNTYLKVEPSGNGFVFRVVDILYR